MKKEILIIARLLVLIFITGTIFSSTLTLDVRAQSRTFTDLTQQWAYQMIKLKEALKFVNKYGNYNEVTVAVVDVDTVDILHPDLNKKIWKNPGEIPNNDIDDDKNGYIDDINGIDVPNECNIGTPIFSHATHIAGIYALSQPNISLMSVRIGLPDWWTGDKWLKLAYTLGSAIEGITYAVDNGADIINLSWGTLVGLLMKFASPYEDAIIDAIRYAANKGVMVTVAAGNKNINQYFPAGIEEPNVITVAAIDETGKKASYSNWGNWIEISAPGEIVSTVLNGEYSKMRGTSMAAPVVGKVATLIKQISPELSPAETKRIITKSANFTDPNYQEYIGAGVINAETSVKVAYFYSNIFKKLLKQLNNFIAKYSSSPTKDDQENLKEKFLTDIYQTIMKIPEELGLTQKNKTELAKFFDSFTPGTETRDEMLSSFLAQFFKSNLDNPIVRAAVWTGLEELNPAKIAKGIKDTDPTILAQILEGLELKLCKDILQNLPFKTGSNVISKMKLSRMLKMVKSSSSKGELIQGLKSRDFKKGLAAELLVKLNMSNNLSPIVLDNYVNNISSRSIAKILELTSSEKSLEILKRFDNEKRLEIIGYMSMPSIDELISTKSDRRTFLKFWNVTSKSTLETLVRLANYGTGRILGFVGNSLFLKVDPFLAAQCLEEIKDSSIFKYLIQRDIPKVRLAFIDLLLERGQESIRNFFNKYPPSSYSIFINEVVNPKKVDFTQDEPFQKIAKLFKGIDSAVAGKIFNGIKPKTGSKILTFLPLEQAQLISQAMDTRPFIKMSYYLLTEQSDYATGLVKKLTGIQKKTMEAYRTLFTPITNLSQKEINETVSILDSFKPLNSAIFLSNVLSYRKEHNLSHQILIDVGIKLKEETIAEFLWFDDYWKTNFEVISEILINRGEKSTANIFDRARTYAVAMVLKAEKLTSSFVAKVFMNMKKEKVLDIVNELLTAPFVGNEQDSTPYLSSVVVELENLTSPLAEEIAALLPEENSTPSEVSSNSNFLSSNNNTGKNYKSSEISSDSSFSSYNNKTVTQTTYTQFRVNPDSSSSNFSHFQVHDNIFF